MHPEDAHLAGMPGPGDDHRRQHPGEEEEVVRPLDRAAARARRPPQLGARRSGAPRARTGDRRRSRWRASRAATVAVSAASERVQKKGTPARKPRKSGGSPSGVRAPPTLATSEMKKTTVWAR